MSAIAGRWNFDGRPGAEDACKRMLAAQELYGPHHAGQWSEGSFAMGRRLFRTLPEDRFDRQPLHSADGHCCLVADVRLDNREELSAAAGLSRAHSERLCDAAILLACLERWGEGALDRIVGDFAFALWDSRAEKLLLARDFLGQRPLHYHCGSNFFAFATMPKGLHALHDVPYAPDEQAMAEFVVLMPENGSRSFFKDIATVGAGHVTTVTRNGISTRRYWEPAEPDRRGVVAKDYDEGVRHHLDQATRSRLRGAAGTVGTHLSGGLDSAAVTATAARLLKGAGDRVVAFTSVPRAGFDGPAPNDRFADEGPLAAATAAMYPNVENVRVRSQDLSPIDELDRGWRLFDRPILNLCNWTWGRAINNAARDRGLGIMLTGQMGNMSISYAGVELLPELLRTGRLIELSRLSARLVAKGTMRWTGVIANTFGPFVPPRLWQWINEAYHGKIDVGQYTAIHPDRLGQLDLAATARDRGLDFTYRPRKNGFETRLWVMRRVDQGNYNKGNLAGWGLDQRDPTADKRLIEYCLGVPTSAFIEGGEARALARRALSDRLPPAVLAERRRGYQAADWFESLTASRDDVVAELGRLAACPQAAQTLDLGRLQHLVEAWPRSGWARQDVQNSYRFALLRGISAGHFLRKVAGTNQ